MTQKFLLTLVLALFLGHSAVAYAEESAELRVASSGQADNMTVTMSVEGIPLKDVLKVLSEQTGFSYVASAEVENENINLSLENVPIRDALASIANANGLRFEQKRGSKVILFYQMSTSQQGKSAAFADLTETRVWRLKYARLSISPMSIGGEATISDLSKAASLSSNSDSSSSSSSKSSGESDSGETTAANTNSSSGLTAAKGIDLVVASLLTRNGRVTLDLHTNSLIVTDTVENLERIEAVIAEIDRPSPQVVIEVYLMEVKKNILSDQGVDWGGTNGALGTLTAGSRTTGFPFTETIFKQSGGVKATTQGTSTFTLGTLNAANFTATLRFITNDSHTRILARPRLLTLNNEAASIKLVTNTSIANTSSQTAAEGQTTINSNVAERTETGIVLKVTPQINEDDSVGLFVEPSITTVAASSFFPTTFLDPTTRTVRTLARVKNNETLVIGGILDRSDDTTYKKVPVLGDVPLLGYVFKYKDGNDLNRELLIFITPHIVNGYESLDSGAGGLAAPYDPSVKKVLDEFMDEEMIRQMNVLQSSQKSAQPVYQEELDLAAAKRKGAGKARLTAALQVKNESAAEMTRTLETISRKK